MYIHGLAQVDILSISGQEEQQELFLFQDLSYALRSYLERREKEGLEPNSTEIKGGVEKGGEGDLKWRREGGREGTFFCVSRKESAKGEGKLKNAFPDLEKVASNVIQPSSYQNTHGSSVFNEKISVKSLLVQVNLKNVLIIKVSIVCQKPKSFFECFSVPDPMYVNV